MFNMNFKRKQKKSWFQTSLLKIAFKISSEVKFSTRRSFSLSHLWRVFKRKFLRKIFGPVRFGSDPHILSNSELYELLNDIDIVQRINNKQLRCLNLVVRMKENATARQVFHAEISESRRRTKSRQSCHRLVWLIGVKARKKQRRLEECVKVDRNPLIGLLMAN